MTHLQKITTLAKKIRKAKPSMKWTDAIKAASRKIKPAAKKEAPKKAVKKNVKRKVAGPKKPVTKTHKDTKSHNVNIKVVSGYEKTKRSGNLTNVIYSRQSKAKTAKVEQGKLFGKIGAFFDTSVIKELDDLKKQYHKLAKQYHPDAGGTTVQFQQLQNEYEKLFKSLLSGSKLTEDQKENEIVIDKAIRDVIDSLINIEDINIELIGKWLWITGNTYPVRQSLKSAGLIFIKKEDKPYWVYKGVESAGRGKTAMEDIKRKYGVFEIKPPTTKKIGAIPKVNKVKLKAGLKRLTKALNKRPI